MVAVTIRNLSDETHRALRQRAEKGGRSTEAEIRAILDDAARPPERVRIGSALVDAFRPSAGDDLVFERDKSLSRRIAFE